MTGFAYFPHTEQDIKDMLSRIGLKQMSDLYSDVPSDCIFNGEYNLPDAMSEQEIRDFFNKLSDKNPKLKVFVGAGAYDHYTPSVISYITSRSEFLTAYTPYQCEISQGTLRYIFEYQSMICSLTGMDVSNASMYDGPTAAAEAMRMALACTKKKNKVLLSAALLPQVCNVIETYARFGGEQIEYIQVKDGCTSIDSLTSLMAAGDVAGVIVPSINRYGIIENLTGFAEMVHAQKAILIEYCDPSALAVLKSPGEWDADVAVGDGQSLGIPLCYGGPYVGFMACKKDYMRKLPGRIVGETRDAQNRRAFVLTLQAREQHIRREKATSNICSNESLMALWVTVYLSLMGPEGLKKVNQLCFEGAHYLYDELIGTGSFSPAFDAPFLKEFVLRSSIPVAVLQKKLYEAGFFGALQMEDGLVSFCVTEKRTKSEIDGLVSIIKECRL